ncbi:MULTISPECIES: GNAT family N-acetyltransferase [Sphingobacterium]|uniref:GNAT family N-acetyltransferase n=1 Tax=Sphingobacterium litopenaei TaxID=2763500 RepID=A0ABR7YGP4_9SPHI|nr:MULTISPECIES: GNAT family N-acetyltransferase [Sphingobacterium]MBD1430478.1 GNAT family N-acetyltransferase [Sphingobacterium litopenaei]NGM73542.1 GNAT family N-acetyltransferase [Sphingobacterium sp. SGL-16]
MIVLGTLDNLNDLVNLFDQYRIFYKKDSDLEGAEKFLSERIKNQESVIYIYYDKNIPVGFTQLYPKYSSARMVRNWILNDLFVLKEYRKTGIATQLINQAIEFAKSKDANFVQLETQVDNFVAQKLYQHLSFELQGPDEEFLLYKKFI